MEYDGPWKEILEDQFEDYLYILHSKSIGRFYVGISTNPQTRLQYHNTCPEGWTTRGRPWELVFAKIFQNRSEAGKAEHWLKKQKKSGIG